MNMTTSGRLLAVAALSLALTSGLAAQQKSDTAKSNAATSPAPVAGKVTLGVAVAEEADLAMGWRASKLLKASVYNDQGQKIGAIDDFVVSPDGALSVAVVDVGGFLGIGGRRVAIPVKQFEHVDPKRIVLQGATKEALKALPAHPMSARPQPLAVVRSASPATALHKKPVAQPPAAIIPLSEGSPMILLLKAGSVR